MLRSLAGGAGLLLILGGVAAGSGLASAGEGLRIDLADFNPSGVEDLPGILDEEAAALRAVAGSGPADLAERLAQTGIARERLREWVPYLDLGTAAPGGAVWSTRTSAEVRGSMPARGRIDLRLAHASGRGDLVMRLSGDPARDGSAGAASIEGRACVRLGPEAFLWAGCLEGSLGGVGPWSDPLRAGASLSVVPRAGIAARTASRGVFLERQGLAFSGWRNREGRAGGLLALQSATRIVWLGLEEGIGRGGGLAIRVGKLNPMIALHSPAHDPPVLRVAAADEAERIRLASAWPLGARADGGGGAMEGSVSRRIHSFRITARGVLLGGARVSSSRGRGALGISWGQSPTSLVCEASGSEGVRRLRVEGMRPMRHGLRARIEAGGRVADGSREGSIDISVSPSRAPYRCEAGCVLRSAAAVPWPSYAGGKSTARFAVHARGSLPHGSARIEFALVAPIPARERPRVETPYIQIAVRGGSPAIQEDRGAGPVDSGGGSN